MVLVGEKKYNVRGTFKLMKTVAGSKEHRCVPRCTASSRYNTVLSFHGFPQDDLRFASSPEDIRLYTR